jgi:hypothetical protein
MDTYSGRRSRRTFLSLSAAGAAAIAVPRLVLAQSPQQAPQQARQRPPQLSPALVEEFVRVAHTNLTRTQELLAEQPALLNATWDWGGGDWETGLGGASHMGNKEIARFLIDAGARMDIFSGAMLGRVDIVKAMLEAFPALLHSKGPHGISLMKHAKKGGDDALAVVALLESRGITS